MTRTCETCRFWSDLIANAYTGGIKALCLARTSPHHGEYTVRGVRCGAWADNAPGSIDDPDLDPARYEKEAAH